MFTLILNIYGFVGLALSFFWKITIFGSFLIQKGVWPYRHGRDVPLVTLILNICVRGSIFNSPSMNRDTDRQTD